MSREVAARGWALADQYSQTNLPTPTLVIDPDVAVEQLLHIDQAIGSTPSKSKISIEYAVKTGARPEYVSAFLHQQKTNKLKTQTLVLMWPAHEKLGWR